MGVRKQAYGEEVLLWHAVSGTGHWWDDKIWSGKIWVRDPLDPWEWRLMTFKRVIGKGLSVFDFQSEKAQKVWSCSFRLLLHLKQRNNMLTVFYTWSLLKAGFVCKTETCTHALRYTENSNFFWLNVFLCLWPNRLLVVVFFVINFKNSFNKLFGVAFMSLIIIHMI